MAPVKPLNPWCDSVLRKARRLVEDSDRRTFAAARFQTLIERVNALATLSAHDTPEPKLERVQHEDTVWLFLEWNDKESGWFLSVGVARRLTEKPRIVLEFSGNPKSYSADNPTDTDIQTALNDYFQNWKSAP